MRVISKAALGWAFDCGGDHQLACLLEVGTSELGGARLVLECRQQPMPE